MTEEDITSKLTSIFMPYAASELAKVRQAGTKFVHYTTADAAVSIIKNKCIWLRNSLLMNDYSEVQHGLRCLEHAWRTDHGKRLRNLMDKLEAGMSERFAASFDSDRFELLHETYLLSISEHGDGVEDKYGRLSMWRAYGSTASVALVFHQNPFVQPSDALRAYTSPVFYGDPEDYTVQFAQLVDGIEANFDFLIERGGGSEWFAQTLMRVFRYSVLSTKHPGFHEEKEWRVIYNPVQNPSDNILKDDVSLNGTPQRIYKIPFIDHPDQGFMGATLPEALKKVIIGPIASPYPTYQTLTDLLEQAHVPNVGEKLICSQIPLRT